MTRNRRIAALFRELAELFDEAEETPKPRQVRGSSKGQDVTLEQMKEELRKRGIKVA